VDRNIRSRLLIGNSETTADKRGQQQNDSEFDLHVRRSGFRAGHPKVRPESRTYDKSPWIGSPSGIRLNGRFSRSTASRFSMPIAWKPVGPTSSGATFR